MHSAAARTPRGPRGRMAAGGTRTLRPPRGWGKVRQAPARPARPPSHLCGVNSGRQCGSLRTRGWKKHMAESGHAAAEQWERRRGCKSGELPPERSNLGSQRSRERPETRGTSDCAACAAVSLASSSHRVRLLTSRAVTSHRAAARRLSLGVPRGAAARCSQRWGGLRARGHTRGGTDPLRSPARTSAPPRRDGLSLRGREAAMPSLPPAPRGNGQGSGCAAGLGTLTAQEPCRAPPGRGPPASIAGGRVLT